MCQTVSAASTIGSMQVVKNSDKKKSAPKTPLDGEKVIAERFRTKKCKNYVRTGECPYESRCMFAHGKHELRSAEQNLEDGLVTEKAIHRFKKAELKTREQTHVEPAAPTPELRCAAVTPMSTTSDSAYGPSSDDDTCSTYDELEISNRTFSENGETFHYNPYGWRAVEVSQA